MTHEEYSQMLAEARDQFKKGTPLFGKDGAFHRVLEDFLNAAMEGEMDTHLQETKPVTRNRRNGKMPKTLQTEYGQIEVETPRDRDGSFEPEIVQKRQTILAEGLSDKIISLYATGQSTSISRPSLKRTTAQRYPGKPSATSPTRYGLRSKAGAHALWIPSIQ